MVSDVKHFYVSIFMLDAIFFWGSAMAMKFLEKLRAKLGFDSQYAMAKHLGMIEASYRYLEKTSKGCELKTLVDIKDKCGISWNELGKLIEDEVKETKKRR